MTTAVMAPGCAEQAGRRTPGGECPWCPTGKLPCKHEFPDEKCTVVVGLKSRLRVLLRSWTGLGEESVSTGRKEADHTDELERD